MSKLIDGAKLLIRWNIRDFELFDYVKRSLQPHDSLERQIPPPDIREKRLRLGTLESKLRIREGQLVVLRRTGGKPRPQPMGGPGDYIPLD